MERVERLERTAKRAVDRGGRIKGWREGGMQTRCSACLSCRVTESSFVRGLADYLQAVVVAAAVGRRRRRPRQGEG
ncbi:hypothetical protein T439DRAFT_212363 [Meredithblackwellia eburnea MCA 4105]